MTTTELEMQPVDAGAVLQGFTSLGDNCEFALVQRRAGVEMLGLLRFAFSKTQPLIEAMQDGFADLDPLQAISIEQPWGDEYVTCFGRRGFYQHTFMRTGSIDPVRLAQQESHRIPFLRRRLIEDLQAAETIFVRKSNTHAPADMHSLYGSMRRYGRNALLWVEQAGGQHPPGSVEQLESGLLRGYVDRFAPYGDATAISFASWLGLCMRTRRLLRGDMPTPAPPPTPLPIGTQADLRGSAEVDCTPAGAVPKLRPKVQVFRHAARTASNAVVAVLTPSATLLPGRTFAATVWVWIPDGFRGRLIAPLLMNTHGATVQPAVLPDRNQWQRIWVSAFVPAGLFVRIGIWADMDEGDLFYTTHWTIEPSDTPGTYLLDSENARTITPAAPGSGCAYRQTGQA